MAIFKRAASASVPGDDDRRCPQCNNGTVIVHTTTTGADGVTTPGLRREQCRSCKGTGRRR